MKTNEEYFAPVPASTVSTPTGLPAQHAQQQRRTILPVVAFGAVLVFLLSGMFGLGYYVSTQIEQPSIGKQYGPVIEKADSVGKFLTEPIEKVS